MNGLQLLTAFLLSLELFAAENLDSYAENIQLLPSGKSEGKGIVLAWLEYDATINIERFSKNADVLMAHLVLWVMASEHVDSNELPRLDIELLDDHLVDIELTVRFSETINLVPDANGPFLIDGENWQLIEQVPIDVAESGDVEPAPDA